MPEAEDKYLHRVITAIVALLSGKRRGSTIGVAILMLLMGFIVRPFLEGFSKSVGEKMGEKVIAEIPKPRIVNLESSKIGTSIYRVAIINRTADIADSEVEHIASALQKQVHEHMAPVWGVDAQISVIKRGEAPPTGHWWLELLDDADVEGALTLPAKNVFLNCGLISS